MTKFCFFHSNKPREITLAQNFIRGAKRSGHKAFAIPLDVKLNCGFDIACMVGVKSSELWYRMQKAGKQTLMFDKGYARDKNSGCWNYWRISFNSHNPSDTLNINYDDKRLNTLGVEIHPWRNSGSHILLAGSSAKYHTFYNISNPTVWASSVFDEIRKLSDRMVYFRPKPSYREFRKIAGTVYSPAKQPLSYLFKDCHAVITHGSNICWEAVAAGIPTIILGSGVTKRISSTSLNEIESPKIGDREPLFRALSYHQWTMPEMQNGDMFETVNRWIN